MKRLTILGILVILAISGFWGLSRLGAIGSGSPPVTAGSPDEAIGLATELPAPDFRRVQDRSKGRLDPGEATTVRMDNGARVTVSSLSMAPDVEVEVHLIRSEAPDSLPGVRPVTPIYYVASKNRPRPQEGVTLEIPYQADQAPGGLRVENLAAYEVVPGGILRQLPTQLDSQRSVAIVEEPEVVVLNPRPGFAAPGSKRVTLAAAAEPVPAPVGYVLAPASAVPARPTCSRGVAGEVHEEPGHAFVLILEQDAPCEWVRQVSGFLQEALDTYAVEFADSAGNPPRGELGPSNRMKVYLGEYPNEGLYDIKSWNGYMKIDVAKGSGDPQALRRTLFHEMFHAVQDHYVNMYAGGNLAHWWYEATAEWTEMAYADKKLPQAVSDYLGTYPEFLSVYLPHTDDFQTGRLRALGAQLGLVEDKGDKYYYYPYSLLIHHVEQQRPGYVRDTLTAGVLQSAASGVVPNVEIGSSSGYYQGLVKAGELTRTYPNFLSTILQHGLSRGSVWTVGRVVETENAAVVWTDLREDIRERKEQNRFLRTEEERSRFIRLELPEMHPMTTLFYAIDAPSRLQEGRDVRIFLWEKDGSSSLPVIGPLGEQASQALQEADGEVMGRVRQAIGGTLPQGKETDSALLALVTYDNPPRVTVRRVSSRGEVIKGLGTQYQNIWVASFNARQDENAQYEIALRIERPSLRDPYARCAQQDYDAAFNLFQEGVDIGDMPRGDGDAYIMTATCAFAHGDYSSAEDLALKGAGRSRRGGQAHNYFIAEYAAERQGDVSSAESHRERGLSAAEGSGQCDGSTGDSCAEGYRQGIRNAIEQTTQRIQQQLQP